jgi:hypothetical protein
LCRAELKIIGKGYPNTITELIQWHDWMALQCMDDPKRDELFGICVETAQTLSDYQNNMRKWGI